MIKNVCVFASSSNDLDKEFYYSAAKLGHLLGINGMNIVYGGLLTQLDFCLQHTSRTSPI